MRPKFVIALFGLTLVVIGAALFLKQYLGNTPIPTRGDSKITGVPATVSNMARSTPSSPVSVSGQISAPTSSPALPPTPAILTPEERQAAADAEIDHLQDWSLNDDPASLSNILNDLTYPDKEVREAAIEAAEQFGSSDAVPVLRKLAANDEDPEERAALLEAADFLSLPPLELSSGPKNLTPEQKQMAEQRRAAMLAHEKAWQEAHAQNQNPHSATPPANGQNPPTAPNNQ